MITRRDTLKYALAASLTAAGVLALVGSAADLRPAYADTGIRIETRSLDELYSAALAEGGRLIVYAGGETAPAHAGA